MVYITCIGIQVKPVTCDVGIQCNIIDVAATVETHETGIQCDENSLATLSESDVSSNLTLSFESDSDYTPEESDDKYNTISINYFT